MMTTRANRMDDRSGPGAQNKCLAAELSPPTSALERLACGHSKCLHDSTHLCWAPKDPETHLKSRLTHAQFGLFFFFFVSSPIAAMAPSHLQSRSTFSLVSFSLLGSFEHEWCHRKPNCLLLFS